MDAAGSDRRSHVVVQPANEVVSNVLRVLLHVSWILRVGILLIHDHRIANAHLLERLVPIQDALLDPITVSPRRRVFDVEHNRLLGRAELQAGVGLFQMPAIDVPDPLLVGVVLAEIREGRREVANTQVRGPGRVTGAVGNQTDGIVQRLQASAVHRNLEAEFDVLRKRLGRLDRRQFGVRAAHVAGRKELRRLAD